jgi:hypothetical protein
MYLTAHGRAYKTVPVYKTLGFVVGTAVPNGVDGMADVHLHGSAVQV